MNLNNVIQVKFNGAEIDLIKFEGIILYKRIPLYEPYEFKENYTITEVRTLVNKTHTSLSTMFYFCKNLTSIDTKYWDTSNVTTMKEMFSYCQSLTTLDLSNFDTSNVANMFNMFYLCTNLTSLDLSNWDTSSVIYIDGMLDGCNKLHTLRLDNCSNDTINKIITSYNFPTGAISGITRKIYCKQDNATGLTAPTNWQFVYVDVEPEEVPLYEPYEYKENSTITEVRTIVNNTHTSLDYMFAGCEQLISVDTTDWDTSNVTNMQSMFEDCYCLAELDLSNWNTSNVTNMYRMFIRCSALTSLDLSNWNTNNVIYMHSMFYQCTRLTSLDLSNWDASKADVEYMLYQCKNLHTLRLDDCSNDTISKIITSEGFPTGAIEGQIRKIYCKQENAAGLTVPINWVFIDIDSGEIIEPEETEIPLYVPREFTGEDITEVRTMVNDSHTDLSYMFSGCEFLITVDTENWDTSNVTNMNNMFESCKSLTSIDINNFNTNKVTNMEEMFDYCESLTSLDLSNWNTSNVTHMNFMFYSCRNLTSLDLSNFNTNNVTNMQSMFQYCTALTSLDLSNFDTSNVSYMSEMLYGCNSLHTLRLDNCSNDTINKIITSSKLSTNAIEGVTRKIYCKEENAAGLTAPTNWQFEYVD